MKKIISILLTTLIVTSLFIGCTNDSEVSDDTKDNVTNDTTNDTTNDSTDTDKESDDQAENTDDDSEVDAVTTASIVDNAQDLVKALSAEGTWIIATLNDITVDEDILVEGQFHDKGDESNPIYRKLALYTQDEDHNIVDQFNLTAPKMTVKSENFKIQGGTFTGDVYVEANGFTVGKEATIEGNVYFASQEYMDSVVVDETAKVTGEMKLQ